MAEKINIYLYTNYRDYLKDWLAYMRVARPLFSIRAFSKKAGFGAPNFFTLVMEGDRNLTEKSVIPFMKGLGLDEREIEYFKPLVFYTQSKSIKKKKEYFDLMLQNRKSQQITYTDQDCYEFYGNWYSPVIRELISHPDFNGDMKWLVRKLGIGLCQLKKSLKTMIRLGLVEQCEDGKWISRDALLSTGDEVKTFSFIEYHNQILDLAKEKIISSPQVQRDVSALTLGVSKTKIPEIKSRIQEFRKEILKLVSNEEVAEDVVILSMQLFPATIEDQNNQMSKRAGLL